MTSVLWAIFNLLGLLAHHVIRLSGDSPTVAREIEQALGQVQDAIANHEGS